MKGGTAPVIATPPFSNRCNRDEPSQPRQQYVSVPTHMSGETPSRLLCTPCITAESGGASPDYDFFVIVP